MQQDRLEARMILLFWYTRRQLLILVSMLVKGFLSAVPKRNLSADSSKYASPLVMNLKVVNSDFESKTLISRIARPTSISSQYPFWEWWLRFCGLSKLMATTTGSIEDGRSEFRSISTLPMSRGGGDLVMLCESSNAAVFVRMFDSTRFKLAQMEWHAVLDAAIWRSRYIWAIELWTGKSLIA